MKRRYWVYAIAIALAGGLFVARQAAVAWLGSEVLFEYLGERRYNQLIPLSVLPLLAICLLMVVLAESGYQLVKGIRRMATAGLPGKLWLGAMTVLLVLGTSHFWIRFQADSVGDSVADRIASLIIPVKTEFATRYSIEGFKRVRVGMTSSMVKYLLGPPLDGGWYLKSPGEMVRIVRYSRSDEGDSYWRRNVVYDSEDLVLETSVGLAYE